MLVRVACLLLLSIILATECLGVDSPFSVEDCPFGLGSNNPLKVYGRSCFQFVLNRKREFEQANRDCKRYGGTLALIKTQDVQDLLYSFLKNELRFKDEVWIGLDDRNDEGTYVWADGTVLQRSDFHNWGDGNGHLASWGPQRSFEDCVVIDVSKGGRWHDYHCKNEFLIEIFKDYTKPYICEYKITKPLLTTPQPSSTTLQPSSTTPQPRSTTQQPSSTTPQQSSTTPQPVSTTPQPKSTTPQPSSTTPQSSPTTPQPSPTTPQPSSTTPQPSPTTPQPSPTTPQPSPTTPQPSSTTPQPSSTTTQPSSTTRKPSSTTPQPSKTTPQPSTTIPLANPTTSRSPPTSKQKTTCPPFSCSLDCGLGGYRTNPDTGCALCQCDD